MKRGQETLMPNWALEAYEVLALASDIKILNYLARHRAYRDNSYTTKQLAIALEIDIRTVRDGLSRLREKGYILSADGEHCLVEAASKMPTAYLKAITQMAVESARPAQGPRKAAARPVQIYPAQNPELSVSDGEKSALNLRTDELMNLQNKKVKDARENAAPILAEDFELIEVPEPQAAVAATAQHPAASLGSAQNSPQPEPKKATSKLHVPRGAAPALPELPADLAALPGMPEAWAQWFEYRRQRRLTTPPLTATGMANRLQRFAAEGDDPVEVIRNAIECGHQGLFRAERPRNLKFPIRPQTTEAADARALHTVQAVYAALQEDEKLAF